MQACVCADASSEYLEAQIYCRFSRSLTRERGRATKRASPASTTIRRLAVDSGEDEVEKRKLGGRGGG